MFIEKSKKFRTFYFKMSTNYKVFLCSWKTQSFPEFFLNSAQIIFHVYLGCGRLQVLSFIFSVKFGIHINSLPNDLGLSKFSIVLLSYYFQTLFNYELKFSRFFSREI